MRRSWPGVAFVVIVVELLLWNGYAFDRNQETFGTDTLGKGPRNILPAAERNVMGVISGTVASYYALRKLEGRTLVIAAPFEGHRFFLERVSRVKVELATEPPTLSPWQVAPLWKRPPKFWRFDPETPLGIIFDPAAARYVLVEQRGGGGILVMPEAEFLAARQRDAEPGERPDDARSPREP